MKLNPRDMGEGINVGRHHQDMAETTARETGQSRAVAKWALRDSPRLGNAWQGPLKLIRQIVVSIL